MLFPPEQLYCVLDYETYSEVDLKKVGAWEYSLHPSTEILCMAWRVGTRETLPAAETKACRPNGPLLFEFAKDILNSKTILVSHNAYFEQVITKNVLAKKYFKVKGHEFRLSRIPPERWLCTASLAATLALPRNLEGAAQALKLPVQKDMDGRRLVLKWCKPKKPSAKDPSTRHTNAAELLRLIEYCKRDVDTEVALFLQVPPLTATERAVWELDQKINLRGFAVDRKLVNTTLKLIDEETRDVNRRCSELTLGVIESATRRDAVLRWLRDNGLDLPVLDKATVKDALESGLATGEAKTMLELRQSISKTSTAKYEALDLRSRSDGRLRDVLVYHAASTGRWAGSGVQPQNLKKSHLKNKDIEYIINLLNEEEEACSVKKKDMSTLEWIRFLYGDPMAVFSSCIRSMIVAPPGKVLDVADYNAIETRVLFWVADHEAGLRAFRENRDLYKEQAASVFNTTVDKIANDSYERAIGKGLILGSGYGMGAKKFAATCRAQGLEIKDELAEIAVSSYRSTHSPVVKLWSNVERAAVAAVENLGKRYRINRATWYVKKDFLFCELPSKRRLAYYGPTVRYEPTPWGDKRPVLYHYGVNGLTRKWEEAKTYGGRLCENIIQAIARDLMAEAMLRIEAAGWEIVLSVHDELVAERDKLRPGHKEFCRLMAELPAWAEGCPVKASGWSGWRYRK